ncbi:diguanylate cyclase domain-containing protein [Calidifontibacillus erzurumensis]|uniref:Diguanylate cyclase n=1 Tax=Calidifontibacillus erzurumensis TaxID=2741433 RepID=A0A8J8GCN5_9BACI|nr:diguanylate cyclase [Calidifontibacillus erzurumensis]NSL50967.1 diguanylate cyclase [Calidifontibacillus erzurumensis]
MNYLEDSLNFPNESIVLNSKIEHLQTKEMVTMLPNFNYFKDIFGKKWEAAMNKLTPISLVVFDIDHLPLYKETYGLELGDLTVKEIVIKVKSLLKGPDDLLAKFADGTFFILLPETNINAALKTAEIIRQSIENMKIPHCQSITSNYVTVSVGVGTKTPFIWEDSNKFLKAVEQAMYIAKKNGRNQVIWNNVYLEEFID